MNCCVNGYTFLKNKNNSLLQIKGSYRDQTRLTRKHFSLAGVLLDKCKAATRSDHLCKSFGHDWMSQLSLAHLLLFVLFDSTVTLDTAFVIDTTDQTSCQMWLLNSSVTASNRSFLFIYFLALTSVKKMCV